MTKSQILKSAHKNAKSAKRNLGGDYIVYLAFYMIKENQNTEEQFELNIPYSDSKTRKKVKRLGARWNSNSKSWTVTCTEKDLMQINAEDYIVKEVAKTKKVNKVNKRWVSANHATPAHFAYESGNYGEDVLSGFYQEG